MEIISLLFSFFMFFIALTVHEFAHGFVAYKKGDPTAKFSGRLTLNPLAHIDPIGTLLLPLFLIISRSPFVFGWAKPVPVNVWLLRNPKKDMVQIALAGPAANFLFAVLLGILYRILHFIPLVRFFFPQLIFLNLFLGAFNLIPVPPLDGSRVVSGLLPYPLSLKYSMIEPYGFIIIIFLLFLGVADWFIMPIVSFLYSLIL